MELTKWSELDENWCPVARTLSVIGDRWTLLILRDCVRGHSRFEEFAESLGVTRHVLSGRLKRLVEAGVLEKRPYQPRPRRYEYVLTEKGRELLPALDVFFAWGRAHMPVRRKAR